MAEKADPVFTYLKGFTPREIRMAIDLKIPEQEKQILLNQLNEVALGLKRASEDRGNQPVVKKKIRVSKEVDFRENYLPKLMSSLREYIQKEADPGETVWDVSISYDTNFEGIHSLAELQENLNKIIQQEVRGERLILVLKYHKGLCFKRAETMLQAEGQSKSDRQKQFLNSMGISYGAAAKYIRFSNLINTFPYLLVCAQTFTELCTYSKQLLRHLETDVELRAELQGDLALAVNGFDVNVVAAEIADLDLE